MLDDEWPLGVQKHGDKLGRVPRSGGLFLNKLLIPISLGGRIYLSVGNRCLRAARKFL